jgi:hypothetical protein
MYRQYCPRKIHCTLGAALYDLTRIRHTLSASCWLHISKEVTQMANEAPTDALAKLALDLELTPSAPAHGSRWPIWHRRVQALLTLWTRWLRSSDTALLMHIGVVVLLGISI